MPVNVHPVHKASTSNRERRSCPSPIHDSRYAISSCNLKTKFRTNFRKGKIILEFGQKFLQGHMGFSELSCIDGDLNSYNSYLSNRSMMLLLKNI